MIVNGEADDIELWTKNLTFASAKNQDTGDPYFVLNIETANIGKFNIPFDPQLAQYLMCNMTQWLLCVAGHCHDDHE